MTHRYALSQFALTTLAVLATLTAAPAWAQCSPSFLDRATLIAWPCCDISTCRDPWGSAIVTDRPDFTEASSTVGRGVAQLEAGYTYFDDDEGLGGLRAHTYPEALLRVGMFADWFEFRIGWTMIDETVFTPVGASSTNVGSDDLYLGAKLALTEQCGMLPEMAILPQMTVPVGSTPFSADQVLAGVNWLYSWEISDRLSVGGSSQFNHANDPILSNGYTEFAQSATLGVGLTDDLGAYFEYFVLAPTGAETVLPEHYFNGGTTYLVNDNLQLDVRAGFGVNDAAIDFFSGAGFSARF